ncbi:MAG: PH domain-containing protein [Thainema sp.]
MAAETTDAVFKAPWGNVLILMTTLGCVILIGIPLIGLFSGPRSSLIWIASMIVMPLAILLGTAIFSVQGYQVANETLYVQRLGWKSAIALDQLTSVEIDPTAMDQSIRTWGNGGLFGFTGHFRNRKLGKYQAYATDFKQSVILRFRDRTVVVTPADPERFVQTLQQKIQA